MNNEKIKNIPVQSKRKILTGKVLSVKTLQTVIVGITTTFRHPLYKKAVKKLQHFAVHNTTLELAVGDTVKIGEIRPVSKTKHFEALEKI